MAELCLIKTLLILLREDRAGASDDFLRTTHREMTGVLRVSFGLDIPLNSFSRLFGRWRARSDRSAVPGFEGQKATRAGAFAVLEEVEVGRMTARGYVPSVYRPTPSLEELLLLEAADEPVPGPDRELSGIEPAGGPPTTTRATEDREDAETEVIAMPALKKIDRDASDPAPRDVLAFPRRKGLADLMVELVAELSPADQERIRVALDRRSASEKTPGKN